MTQGARWLRRVVIATLGGVTLASLATLAARYVRARPPLLDRVRAFNRRRLNPLTLGVAGRRGAYFHALRHVGRRSGRVYTTPLEAFALGDAFAIPMTYGLRADWARNTLAAGGATLLREGEALAVTRPRVVMLDTVSHALPLIERLGLRALGVDELLLVERAERLVVRDLPPAEETARIPPHDPRARRDLPSGKSGGSGMRKHGNRLGCTRSHGRIP